MDISLKYGIEDRTELYSQNSIHTEQVGSVTESTLFNTSINEP